MAIVGHVSKALLEHYSRVRMNAKRKALAALEIKAAPVEEPKEQSLEAQAQKAVN
jgi:hypothetical protein